MSGQYSVLSDKPCAYKLVRKSYAKYNLAAFSYLDELLL